MNKVLNNPDQLKSTELKKKQSQLTDIAKSIQNEIDKSLYLKLSNINGKLLFKYTILFIIVFKIILVSNITFSIFISLMIALIFVYINYDKDTVLSTTKDKQIQFKLNSIYPSPNHFKKHSNVIEFVYSIKDFRLYNPDSFDKMLQCIDNVLQLYNEILIGVHNMNHHIDNMMDNKKKAINYLHSIIYTMEPNDVIINKLNKSIKVLDTLLTYYINEVIDISNKQLKKHGYNITSKKFYKDELDGISINPTNNYTNSYDLSHFIAM